MITLLDFLDKYLGKSKGYPTDKNYKGECLSIAKLYIKEVFGLEYPPASGCNGARCYYSKFPAPLDCYFTKVKNTPTLIPKEGWIVIWKAWKTNLYGHIAIVANGSTKTVLMNYAQNWSSKIFQLEKNNYNNVEGYLVPIKESGIIEDMNIDEQVRILAFLANKTEGDVREAFGALADIGGKKEQIEELKEENEILIKDYGDLEKIYNDLTVANKALSEKLKEIKPVTKKLSLKEILVLLINKIFSK